MLTFKFMREKPQEQSFVDFLLYFYVRGDKRVGAQTFFCNVRGHFGFKSDGEERMMGFTILG